MSTTQPSNFMSKIPHEIHGEIFAHCIQRNPFRLDPDAYYYDDSSDEGTYDQYALRPQHINVLRVLRLGHVCRLWREIVLETASLWTHLDYCLHILQTNSDLKPKWAVLKSDIEFIRWWKAKHRLIPPFICLKANVTFQNHKAEANWDLNGLDVILEYLTTARFLE
ncbi:hypothetical protein BDN70DRAFT_931779 [Pholiota conissans]|uniref:F-box domain-containing protein n=1 Tax=Pholiota conissans TaxID=109636 RepID=A0A9P5Z6N5_9AGAR|nr:hypothetical protein BDN70DRAFT_931779 [Pholiota conissans]